MGSETVHEVIGVYDADGSLRGELAYVLGRLTGRSHCALCDVTHGHVRPRRSFELARRALGVPLTLVHRDEQPPDVAVATDGRAPIVLGRTDAGLIVLLDSEDLRRCDSSPDAFFSALEEAVATGGLRLASWRS